MLSHRRIPEIWRVSLTQKFVFAFKSLFYRYYPPEIIFINRTSISILYLIFLNWALINENYVECFDTLNTLDWCYNLCQKLEKKERNRKTKSNYLRDLLLKCVVQKEKEENILFTFKKNFTFHIQNGKKKVLLHDLF